jgi:hypothetical protein
MKIGAAAAVIAIGGAGAATAATSARLTLKKVSKPPRSADVGDIVRIKARLTNDSALRSGHGALKLTLVGGPKAYGVPRRIIRVKTGRMAPGSFKRFTVSFSVPRGLSTGTYRVQTCLKSFGYAKQRCALTRGIKVTGAA